MSLTSAGLLCYAGLMVTNHWELKSTWICARTLRHHDVIPILQSAKLLLDSVIVLLLRTLIYRGSSDLYPVRTSATVLGLAMLVSGFDAIVSTTNTFVDVCRCAFIYHCRRVMVAARLSILDRDSEPGALERHVRSRLRHRCSGYFDLLLGLLMYNSHILLALMDAAVYTFRRRSHSSCSFCNLYIHYRNKGSARSQICLSSFIHHFLSPHRSCFYWPLILHARRHAIFELLSRKSPSVRHPPLQTPCRYVHRLVPRPSYTLAHQHKLS